MQGHISNFEDGIIDQNKLLGHYIRYFEEMYALEPYLKGCDW